jgi:DHA1 family tetracycline resistance protein-like MFS transporter
MKKSALIFIFITLVIDCIGIGIIIPVMAGLVKEITNLGTSEASAYGGYLGVTYALMQFIFSPIMGNLSDQYGRRPVLLLSLLGLGIDYIFLAFAPSLMWLFVGRLIAGISGASFTTGMAYIADISTPEKRAANFGLVGAAFGLGFILGPIIGGFTAEIFDNLRAPFLVAAGFSLINLLNGSITTTF